MATALAARPVKPEDWKALGKTLEFDGGEVDKAFPSIAVCVCPDGATILSQGESGNDIYIVLKGEVSVRLPRWFFLEKEVARIREGELFGEINFLMPTARSATVVAAGPCEVFRISAKDLKGYLDSRPEVRARVEETARQRLYALSSDA